MHQQPRGAPRQRVIPPPQSPPYASELLRLPPDCLEFIICALSPTALALIRGACRHLHSAASREECWKGPCRSLWPGCTTFTSDWYAARVRLFRGVTICCTGMHPAARERAHKAAMAMGGVWSRDLAIGPGARGRATHLLCVNALSLKAIHAWGKINVCHPDWLEACIAHGSLRPCSAHPVQPLEGTNICTTGLNEDRIAWAASLVTRMGGLFDRKLTTSTTHLIVGPYGLLHPTEKMSFVIANPWLNVSVVHVKWLSKIEQLERPVEPSRFRI